MDNVLSSFIEDRRAELDLIGLKRKGELSLLSKLINTELIEKGSCRLTIICTHNSRRSQLAEFLLRIIAHEMELHGIETYSGGTEATAFNYRMVKALEDFGFEFDKTNDVSNPKYNYLSDQKELTQVMFSKVYNHSSNPQEDYIAVMVCDHADQNCPIVIGATHRFSLPYIDPKVSDDSPTEERMYKAKVEEIGREMLYLCDRILELES